MEFRKQKGRNPTFEDFEGLMQLTETLLEKNGLSKDHFNKYQLNCLCGFSEGVVMVSSIVGGFLSQEVMKAISHVGEPMRNVVVFSGKDLVARVFLI